VAHAISASSYRSDHLSPSALALALLLHGLVAAALWWMTQHRTPPPMEEAIEVSFEQPKPPEPKPPEPKPPEPKPPEAQQKPPPPAPPEPPGLMPEAAITAEKRTQVPTAPVRPNEAPAPAPPAQADKPQPFAFSPSPSPPPVSKPVSPPEAVARPPEQPPTPTRPPEQPQTPFSTALPAPALPTPTLPPAHALAPPLPTPPETHALAAPPLPRASPAPQRPDLRPAPPTTAPTQRPAAPAHSEPPSNSPFVNPADTYNRARVADNYLWQVARKLQGYRYEAHVSVSHGTTVVRVTIARDGRLLDVVVAQSSGVPEFDRGVLAGVRSGSPYEPLPPDIQGASATFNLPLVSVNRQ
jgi:TonB family protein